MGIRKRRQKRRSRKRMAKRNRRAAATATRQRQAAAADQSAQHEKEITALQNEAKAAKTLQARTGARVNAVKRAVAQVEEQRESLEQAYSAVDPDLLEDLGPELQAMYEEAMESGGEVDADEWVAFQLAVIDSFDDRLDELEADDAANDLEHAAFDRALGVIGDSLAEVYAACAAGGLIDLEDAMANFQNGVVFINGRALNFRHLIYGLFFFRASHIVDTSRAGDKLGGFFGAPRATLFNFTRNVGVGDDIVAGETGVMAVVGGVLRVVPAVVGAKAPAGGVAFSQFTGTVGFDMKRLAAVVSVLFGAQFLPPGMDMVGVLAAPALTKVIGIDLGSVIATTA